MRSRWPTLLVVAVLSLLAPVLAWGLTVAEEIQVGRRAVAEQRRFGLTVDPSLNALGKRLAAVVKRKELTWRFWVVEDMKEYNAFAAPGGFVFITRSYYEQLNDDEAAFVLGHEMAHVDLRHYEKQVSREQRANLGNLLLRVLTPGDLWATAADLGATAYVTHYSRVLEREADFTGYEYAQEAGYDARAAVSALSKLGKQPKLHPWIANIYATHPILSSREDQLTALGGKEPEAGEKRLPSPTHKRDLTAGLQPLDPPRAMAVRILGSDGKRWENRWRKSFTRLLHIHLTPLGFKIAGDDLMYQRDIGDPVAAARSRQAAYLLLVTVEQMESEATSRDTLAGTTVRAELEVSAKLVAVTSGEQVGQEIRVVYEKAGVDLVPADPEMLYTDTVIGQLADQAAGEIAVGCARALGAKPASPGGPAPAS